MGPHVEGDAALIHSPAHAGRATAPAGKEVTEEKMNEALQIVGERLKGLVKMTPSVRTPR